MMTKLLVYGYCIGVRSSRAIERATYDVVPFRMLSADQHPDHDSIADFRRRHFDAFQTLFAETVRVAREAGLADLAHVSVDGSKIEANASKHKSMSYDRMQDVEKELQSEIDSILAEAESKDNEEDAKFGKGRRGDELPKELQRRQDRIKKIREAKKRLEERARAEAAGRAEEAEKKIAERRELESQTGQKPSGRDPKVPNPEEARPDPKMQCNFTDPDSRIMMDGASKEFIQAYNAQNAVDGKCGIILGTHLTQAGNDAEQLAPTIAEVIENCGASPEIVSADAGYCSDAALNDERLRDVDLYVATGRERKAAEAIAKRTAALAARLASLFLAVCTGVAGTAAGPGQITAALIPGMPLALNVHLQYSHRRRRALRLAMVALALTTQAALGVGSIAGISLPTPEITFHTARERMRRKLRTEAGKTVYRRRKAIAEGPFGILKDVLGMRRFLVRGLSKVQGEWNLATTCFNLLKMFRHGKQRALEVLGKENGPGCWGWQGA